MSQDLNIYLDRSGTLVPDLFFRFDDTMTDNFLGEPAEGAILSHRSPTEWELNKQGTEYLTVNIVRTRETVHHRCPTFPHHETERETTWAKYRADRGPLAEFVCGYSESGFVGWPIPGTFATKLRESGLTGYRLVKAKPQRPNENDTYLDLHILNFVGHVCWRPESVHGAPNACPYCGNAPLICPECSYRDFLCSQCGKLVTIPLELHEGPGDIRLTTGNHTKGIFVPPILNGDRWDGSDFIYPYFISKRALDWLLSMRAAPFYAEPAVICIDGMNDEQREWLERAKQPIGE